MLPSKASAFGRPMLRTWSAPASWRPAQFSLPAKSYRLSLAPVPPKRTVPIGSPASVPESAAARVTPPAAAKAEPSILLPVKVLGPGPAPGSMHAKQIEELVHKSCSDIFFGTQMVRGDPERMHTLVVDALNPLPATHRALAFKLALVRIAMLPGSGAPLNILKSASILTQSLMRTADEMQLPLAASASLPVQKAHLQAANLRNWREALDIFERRKAPPDLGRQLYEAHEEKRAATYVAVGTFICGDMEGGLRALADHPDRVCWAYLHALQHTALSDMRTWKSNVPELLASLARAFVAERAAALSAKPEQSSVRPLVFDWAKRAFGECPATELEQGSMLLYSAFDSEIRQNYAKLSEAERTIVTDARNSLVAAAAKAGALRADVEPEALFRLAKHVCQKEPPVLFGEAAFRPGAKRMIGGLSAHFATALTLKLVAAGNAKVGKRTPQEKEKFARQAVELHKFAAEVASPQAVAAISNLSPLVWRLPGGREAVVEAWRLSGPGRSPSAATTPPSAPTSPPLRLRAARALRQVRVATLACEHAAASTEDEEVRRRLVWV
eukprot:tig00020572_g11555.t1